MGSREDPVRHQSEELVSSPFPNLNARCFDESCAESSFPTDAEYSFRRFIASSYLPAIYIPSLSEKADGSLMPIRYIQLHASSTTDLDEAGLKPFSSPNFITGLAAAIGSEVSVSDNIFSEPVSRSTSVVGRPLTLDQAVHPSSAVGPSTPMTILQLPLPLSSISNKSVSSAMAILSPHLGDQLTSQTKSPTARWTEDDDEPFSAPGMGGNKRTSGAALKEDISGMYM